METGNGAWADIKARFWQGERHARGVSDVPYNINMLVKRPFRWRTFVVFYHVFECFVMPALIPWALAAMSYQDHLLYRYNRPNPEMINTQLLSPIFTYNTICMYVSYFCYWLIKRRANTVLYDIENESILRIIEYPLMFPINTALITIPCYIIASFGALFEGREYIVA